MKLTDNASKSIYKKQAIVAVFGLLAEVPNLVLTIIFAFQANTVLCWIDTIVSVSIILHYSIVVYVSAKMTKENGDKYNYGVERLEVFSSFICDLLISLTMLILLGTSIYGLFVPQQPEQGLLGFLIVKIANVAFDVVFLINGIIIVKKRKSRLNETEVNNYLNSLIHDAVIMFACIACYILKDNIASAYISPIVGIISILYFLFTYFKHIRSLVKELSDVSIPVEGQDELLDIVLNNREGIKKIQGINCHTLNSILYVDIVLSFKDEITYEKQKSFMNTVTEKIHEKHPKARVRLVFEDEVSPSLSPKE